MLSSISICFRLYAPKESCLTYYFRILSSKDLNFAFLPQAHVFKAERLLSRWSALIPGDEKLLLALLQWSRSFPVIATSMHRKATACGGEIAGISHAEPRKGNGPVAFDEWWIALTLSHLISIWDNWVTEKKNVSALRKSIFPPDWGRC